MTPPPAGGPPDLAARKDRARADRHRLIVTSARELAEAEGWDAVTTRRLAERIEYSQPVLYTHFRGKDEIVAAVAVDGLAELAAALRRDVPPSASPAEAVLSLATTYVDFAARHPAVYDAMFVLSTGLPFADPSAPAPLRDAFAALQEVLADVAGGTEPGLFTSVAWAGLHGLVTLTRAGRLPVAEQGRRIEVLVDRLVADAEAPRRRTS